MVSDMEERVAYFLACCKLKGLVDRTIKSYKTLLLDFAKFVNKPVNIINSIDVRRYLVKLKDKGNKERRVRFSTRTKIELQEYINTREGDSKYLFISTKYQYSVPLSGRTIQDEFKRILKRSGLDINIFPHLMRHNFATNSANKGMSLFTLQNLLGHSSPSTTQKYITNNINNIDRDRLNESISISIPKF